MLNFINRIIEIILYKKDKFFNNPNLDNGFISQKPKQHDYKHEPTRLGFVPKIIFRPDMQWDFYRPVGELQKRKDRDKMACVTFSAMNCIETIINFFIAVIADEELQKQFNNQDLYEIKEIVKVFKHFGLIKNNQCECSDRYIAKLSGTTERGNNQNNVAQAIRHFGLVPEDLWPYVHDFNEYYKNIPDNIIQKGKELLEYIKFNHEWVAPKNFNTERKYGPIQTSIYAGGGWRGNGIYPRQVYKRNHAIDTDGFVWKEYDKVLDSYKPFDKKVAWDSDLGWGKLFSIHLKKPIKNEREKLLDKGTKFVIRADANGEFYKIENNRLVYIRGEKEIKKALSELANLNENLINLTKQKKILWIPEELYNRLK